MSAKLYQSMILQVKGSITSEISVLDAYGVVLASSNLSKIGAVDYQATQFLQSPNSTHYTETYKKITDENGKAQNLVSVNDTDQKAIELCALFATTISSVNSLYDNKYDKTTFIKNILLDNILPGDIYVKSTELSLDEKTSKAVILVRKKDLIEVNLLDILASISKDEGHYVVYLNPRDVAIVFTQKETIEQTKILKFATEIEQTLKKNKIEDFLIGYGSANMTLESLSKSYKEAQIAIEISEVFDEEKRIIGYQNLGIGRLIYQLPMTLCKMFLSEVFIRGSIENLDDETLSTIKAFFENNLNVSETSRKLFVHRNTLVYRLEKIKKITGLDLREFDHAIIFKVALMVRKYLDARDKDIMQY